MRFLPVFDVEGETPWASFNLDSKIITEVQGFMKQFPVKSFSTSFEKWVEQ